MNDRNLVRGLFLIAISLAFGLGALRYPIGDFGRAGPGLFPLLVSSLLLLIGVATIVRSRFVERVPLDFNVKNIAIILGSLCGFALISQHVNMIAGIVFMVFCVDARRHAPIRACATSRSPPAWSPSPSRFQKLLGLQPAPLLTWTVLHNLAFGFEHALTLQNLHVLRHRLHGRHAGRPAARASARWPPSACCCR